MSRVRSARRRRDVRPRAPRDGHPSPPSSIRASALRDGSRRPRRAVPRWVAAVLRSVRARRLQTAGRCQPRAHRRRCGASGNGAADAGSTGRAIGLGEASETRRRVSGTRPDRLDQPACRPSIRLIRKRRCGERARRSVEAWRVRGVRTPKRAGGWGPMARHPPALALSLTEPPAAPRLSLTVAACRLERPRPHCILPGLERCVDLLLCRIQHATGRLLH